MVVAAEHRLARTENGQLSQVELEAFFRRYGFTDPDEVELWERLLRVIVAESNEASALRMEERLQKSRQEGGQGDG